MKYTIVGDIFSGSGYSSHVRQTFNALAKTEDVKLVTNLIPNWYRFVNDKELEAIKKEDEYDRIKIIITHPVYWKVNCTNKRNWVFLVWEGDKVPKSFIEEIFNPNIEKIIVPSEHTRKAVNNTFTDYMNETVKVKGMEIVNAEIMHKIVTIPHGVDHEIFKPQETKKDKFTFIVNKGFRNMLDRGGSQYALAAYLKEFTNKDNVRMILKINPVYGVPDINNFIKTLAPNRDDLPELIIDTGMYEYKDLNKLYNMGDVFVCTTRAEGFGLPCIEAMACGLPVLYTDYGGQTEFCVGWKAKYQLEEIKHEIQYEGIQWATPDVDDIMETMRNLYENREVVKEKGKEALEKSKEYSWDLTAEKIKKLTETGVPRSV